MSPGTQSRNVWKSSKSAGLLHASLTSAASVAAAPLASAAVSTPAAVASASFTASAVPPAASDAVMQALSAEEIQRLFADGIVRHGPFAGLCYPVLTSICSSLYPKLLGSYEAEIHPWIEEICRTGYTEVINVGCGEGYYAVGLALRLPRARVLAYDVYPEAQRLCAEMAEANGVAERVEVRGAFTPDELEFIPIRERGLILCDCEGCESHVFTADSMPRYAGWDLLIETHDFVEITISTRLTELLQPSQNLRTVLSVDDIQKAKTYAYPELDGLDLATRRAILAECRPTIMEWLFLRTAQPEAPV